MCIFFFNDTATTEIYTLSLHDALPISQPSRTAARSVMAETQNDRLVQPETGVRTPSQCTFVATTSSAAALRASHRAARIDRKSTRLNSSHANISYAVFCLKKKKITNIETRVSCHRVTRHYRASPIGRSQVAARQRERPPRTAQVSELHRHRRMHHDKYRTP